MLADNAIDPGKTLPNGAVCVQSGVNPWGDGVVLAVIPDNVMSWVTVVCQAEQQGGVTVKNLEEMAAEYVDELERTHPHSPVNYTHRTRWKIVERFGADAAEMAIQAELRRRDEADKGE